MPPSDVNKLQYQIERARARKRRETRPFPKQAWSIDSWLDDDSIPDKDALDEIERRFEQFNQEVYYGLCGRPGDAGRAWKESLGK